MKLLVAWMLLCSSVMAEQLRVDFAQPIRAFDHAGSGFLHSMSATQPSTSLIAPLKPSIIRAWPGAGTQARAASLGADYHIVVSDSQGYQAPWPGDNGSWTAWESLARSVVQNQPGAYYDIWNEPDLSGEFWGRSESQWLETWRRGFNAIRSVDPSAKIVGPSVYDYNGTITMHEFLDYAKANNVVPDVINYHCFACDIIGHTADLRSYMAAKGISDRPITLNEIMAEGEAYLPGAAVGYFSDIERSKIAGAAKSCWGTCNNNSLDGLLTSSSQPRSIWWAYERYGQMHGTSVQVTVSQSLDGVATMNGDLMQVLVGRFSNTNTPAQVLLDHLTVPRVHVFAELIPNSGTAASSGPQVRINADIDVVNNQLLLTLLDLGANYDAYFITITPDSPTVLGGDFNSNGVVDAADYVVWRNTSGSATSYSVWRTNFGRSLVAGVPEASTLQLFLAYLLGACLAQLRWR